MTNVEIIGMCDINIINKKEINLYTHIKQRAFSGFSETNKLDALFFIPFKKINVGLIESTLGEELTGQGFEIHPYPRVDDNTYPNGYYIIKWKTEKPKIDSALLEKKVNTVKYLTADETREISNKSLNDDLLLKYIMVYIREKASTGWYALEPVALSVNQITKLKDLGYDIKRCEDKFEITWYKLD